jgi:hypothetical protein
VILEMGILLNFCTNWSQTMIFLISTSQVARIIGISHWCQLFHLSESGLRTRKTHLVHCVYTLCRGVKASNIIWELSKTGEMKLHFYKTHTMVLSDPFSEQPFQMSPHLCSQLSKWYWI